MNPTALQGAPFEWGATDCVCVTYRWIDWLWGTRLADLVLRRYRDEDAAYIYQLQIQPVAKLKDAKYSLFAGPPERSGDVLIGRRERFVSMGFVWRDMIWSSAKKHGVFSVPVGRYRLLDWGWHLCRRQSQ